MIFDANDTCMAVLCQLPKFARDAIAYAESILDSVMGGLEGLINILDSEGGYGSLDNKVSSPSAKGCCQIFKVFVHDTRICLTSRP